MFGSLRAAMTWLHTWFGLVLGFVLMVVFFFGSLAVFDREIDRWALPETRFAPQPTPSFDASLRPIFERIEPDEHELEEARGRAGRLPDVLPLKSWSVYRTHRDPVIELYAEFDVQNPNDPEDHVHGHVTIDPRSGGLLPQSQLKVGSDFLYPMHYMLHLEWMSLGYWVVGVAALVMLAAIVSGVVIHRKIFRELFTLRPRKNAQRTTLDLHNLTGVAGLPFHFVFALSGLTIFAGVYFEPSDELLEPMARAYESARAESQGLPLKPAGVQAPLASVDAMAAEAKRRWAARGMPGEVGWIYVNHVEDANGTVSIYRAGSDRVSLVGQPVHFEAQSGRVIREDPAPSAITGINEFLTGLHLQHFEHWLLRWLYVLGGLSGCVCIATGLVFFVRKRRARHAAEGARGARWVEALAVTSVTGMVVATLTLLVANRVLPSELGDWQERSFWAAWLLCFVHAVVRSAPVEATHAAPAWREQCWAVATLAIAAPVANWFTTGDHLARTLADGYWPVAGFDLVLLVTGMVGALSALKLGRRARAAGASVEDRIGAAPGEPETAHG